MRLPFFQIDAFANAAFQGNPAAVMPLEAFLPDSVLQQIAAENNLSETAFIVGKGQGQWDLRWFTPTTEVPICGHATLAAAHAIFAEGGYTGDTVTFHTASGPLVVTCQPSAAGTNPHYAMQLPASPPRQIATPAGLAHALGEEPAETWVSHYIVAVFDTPNKVRALSPDFAQLAHIGRDMGPDAPKGGPGNISAVARGTGFGPDLIVRFFGPGVGINEDPATGSAYCGLAPLFADRLMKPSLTFYQAFPGRGAHIEAHFEGGPFVTVTGSAVTVIAGEFRLSR